MHLAGVARATRHEGREPEKEAETALHSSSSGARLTDCCAEKNACRTRAQKESPAAHGFLKGGRRSSRSLIGIPRQQGRSSGIDCLAFRRIK